MEHIEVARKFVQYTQQHIFLTGKAGTGKTTFLQNLKASEPKKMITLAPTGVAAINAGGVTIHSFFQLHFGLFIPHYHTQWGEQSTAVINTQQLLNRLKFNSNKRKIINELELIIIDEISMVRADVIDAIDTILQHVRKKPGIPFGGIQMLFIGDLYQLPPVLREDEKRIMAAHYRSSYFFDALAFRNEQPLCIALQHIYRQNDADFIHLLNNIRNGTCTQADLALLDAHYDPVYTPYPEEKIITLTTHNAIADEINSKELTKIAFPNHTLKAKVEGEFPEQLYPIDTSLQFKVSAQVMFIKNDKGENRRYFNGKLATIEAIDTDNNQIVVSFENEKETFVLEPEVWSNIRYRFDEEKNSVEEETIGTFTQFPLKLAWAVTIHKSQGLTFDKAIIDAGRAFAPGQVYVALSRLRSLKGLTLKSRISASGIATDPLVQEYSREQLPMAELIKVLKFAQADYIEKQMGEAYNYNNILESYQHIDTSYNPLAFYNEEQLTTRRLVFQEHLFEVVHTGLQFQRQVQSLASRGKGSYPAIRERLEKAAQWFQARITGTLLPAFDTFCQEAQQLTKSKKFFKDLQYLKRDMLYKIQLSDQSLLYINGLLSGMDPDVLLQEAHKLFSFSEFAGRYRETAAPAVAADKIATHEISYQMYVDGRSIAEIARERNLVPSTIESHLLKYVAIGQLNAELFIEPDKLRIITRHISHHPDTGITQLKNDLGDHYSYTEIKAALAYLQFKDSIKS